MSLTAETISSAHEACCSVLGEATVNILSAGRFSLRQIVNLAAMELFMKKASPDGVDYLCIWKYMDEVGK